MSPKVDQTSGGVFSVNNTRQAAVIHYQHNVSATHL